MSARVRVALAVALAAGGAVVAIALLARDGVTRPVGLPIGSAGMSARTAIFPRAQLFGTQVVARLDLLIDREVVDPDTITVSTNFAPYRTTGKPRLDRVDYERLTRIRYSVALECLEDACAPLSNRQDFRFAPAQIRASGRVIQRPHWPELTVASRLQNPTPDTSDIRSQRGRQLTAGLDWRAEIRVRPVTWAIDPTQATVVLIALALVLLAASFFLVTLAYPGLASRLWRRPARLSPLERALALLERASERGVEEEHRVALDDLATELRALGARELAGTAYSLAWAEPAPAPERTAGLSDRVRELIDGRANGRP